MFMLWQIAIFFFSFKLEFLSVNFFWISWLQFLNTFPQSNFDTISCWLQWWWTVNWWYGRKYSFLVLFLSWSSSVVTNLNVAPLCVA